MKQHGQGLSQNGRDKQRSLMLLVLRRSVIAYNVVQA